MHITKSTLSAKLTNTTMAETAAGMSEKQRELYDRIDRSRNKKRVSTTLVSGDDTLPKLPVDKPPHRAAFDAALKCATKGRKAELPPEEDPTNAAYKDVLPKEYEDAFSRRKRLEQEQAEALELEREEAEKDTKQARAEEQDAEAACKICGSADSDGLDLMQCFTIHKGFQGCYDWYHPTCCGLGAVPRGDWLCMGCANKQQKDVKCDLEGMELLGSDEESEADEESKADITDKEELSDNESTSRDGYYYKKPSGLTDSEGDSGDELSQDGKPPAKPPANQSSAKKQTTTARSKSDSESEFLASEESSCDESLWSDGEEEPGKKKARTKKPVKRKSQDSGSETDFAGPKRKKSRRSQMTKSANGSRTAGIRPETARQQFDWGVRSKVGCTRITMETLMDQSTPYTRADDCDPDHPNFAEMKQNEKHFPYVVFGQFVMTNQAANPPGNAPVKFLADPVMHMWVGSKKNAKFVEKNILERTTIIVHNDFNSYVQALKSEKGKDMASEYNKKHGKK